MRILRVVAFLFLSSLAIAQNTATITAHLADPGSTAVSSRTFVRSELKNTGGQQCKIGGVALVSPYVKDFTPNATGDLSFSIYKTSVITCGTSTGNAQWAFTIWRDGKPQPSCFLQVSSDTNLNSASCLNSASTPVTVQPTDAVYARVDASNAGFTGTITAPSATISGAETSQTDNQVYQVNKFATGGAGTSVSPWTSSSGSGGLFEAITAAGTADGGNGRIHMPAGWYSWTTCVNGTANIASTQGNSAPPTPLMIDGDGPGKTIIVGSTSGCGIDFTGRTFSISEMTFIQGASNKSTLFILQGRATNSASSFPAGNVVKHVVCTLATNPAANGGNGTICVYNYSSEGTHYSNNSVTADHPYVATSNNMFSIASAYQTQNTAIRFISQNVYEDGSCTGGGIVTGECILLQGHAANTTIRNLSGECGGATPPPVFLRIKAPTTPDNASDPLPGLNIQNSQSECPTGGQLIVTEQILAAPKIHGTVTNLVGVPIITLSTSAAQLINPEINIQSGNAAVSSPLVSDAGSATAGILGGKLFLHSIQTIALTNAASQCAGVEINSAYSSPSITCNNAAGNFCGILVTPTAQTINSCSASAVIFNSPLNFQFAISGANQFVLGGLYATFSKTIAITEAAPSSAVGLFTTTWADTADHMWKFNPNNSGEQHVPQVYRLTAQYTNSTTGFTTVGTPNIAFPVNASQNYTATCHLYYQAAATGGLNIQFTGPAAATAVNYGITEPTSASAENSQVATAFSTSLGAAVVTATTNFDAIVSFSLINGVNAGTVTLQAKSSAAAQLQIQAGSYCQVQ